MTRAPAAAVLTSFLLSGCFCTLSGTPSKDVLKLDPVLLSDCPGLRPPTDRSEQALLRWAQDARNDSHCYKGKRDALLKALSGVFELPSP